MSIVATVRTVCRAHAIRSCIVAHSLIRRTGAVGHTATLAGWSLQPSESPALLVS